MFYPKILTTLKDYSPKQFGADLVAGIVVGVVAIPLAIAFAIASGVTPDKGLATAVVAGFLISALGGSRVQIGGPTGAFVVIVYGIVQKYGFEGLTIATFMAGILLIVMGIARFGVVIKFIPRSVVVGFTSGIAVIIFSSQVADFFGLKTPGLPADFIEKWRALSKCFGSVNPYAIGIALATVLLISLWPRISRKFPGSLAALLLCSAAAAYFKWPVDTIGSRFGDLPHTLPMPHLPSLSFAAGRELFQAAFTIALLGGIESLLSAVVSDGMIGGRHRSNTELIGQGIANIGSSLFGGMPATGAIARTMTNVRNGGRTPVAGIIHAVVVLLMLLFFGKYVRWVPMPCLAGILVVIAYHMSEWRSFSKLARSSKGAAAILVTTFLTTIFVDLTAAIELGVVLSSFLFIKRMADVTSIKLIAKEIDDGATDENHSIAKFVIPDGVQVYEIHGPLFFGAADRFEEIDRVIAHKPRVRILRFRDVPLIDSSGLHALESFYQKCKDNRICLIVTGLHVQPLNEMVKSSLYDLIGEANVFSSMKDALQRASELTAPVPAGRVNK